MSTTTQRGVLEAGHSESGRTVVHSSATDEAEAIGGRVYHPHTLQLLGRHADFQMRLESADTAGLTIGLLEYSSPVRITTGALADYFQVNFAYQGRVLLSYGGQQVTTTPAVAGVHGPDKGTTLEGWSEPARLLGVKVPKGLLHRELEVLLDRSPDRPVRFDGAMDMETELGREWRQAADLLARRVNPGVSLFDNPLVAESAMSMVVRGLLLAAPNNYTVELTGETPSIGPSAVRRSIEYINAHARQPLTVESIAAYAHVSVRSLQQSFREHIGATPMAYLRSVRMSRVRDELLQAPMSDRISAVAARWGFAQPGRFAVQYAQTFGEHPSETAMRSPNR